MEINHAKTRMVLVLAANPKDTTRLRLDQEVRDIEEGLQRARKRDEFILRPVLAARPKDIRRAMLDFQPSVIHFCGHGEGEAGLVFEDESGTSRLVSAEVLAGFFELFADKVECVVLNACYSETQAKAIAKSIPIVIGMQKDIPDTAAIEFAVAFYDALGAGQTYEYAFKMACNAIQWGGYVGNMQPVMMRKDPEPAAVPVYDSQKDPDFEHWTMHSSSRAFRENIQFQYKTPSGETAILLNSPGGESVGINKSLGLLHGKVECKYQVLFSEAAQPNVYFCMIPMQETGVGRTGLIEVGSNMQADPRNPYSQYRKRWYVPLEHYGDGLWHQASFTFDFRQTPTAFYSIFAARINEGCSQPACAKLLISGIRIYSLE